MIHVCKIIDPLTVYIQLTMKVTFCKHLKVCYDKVRKKNYIYIYFSHDCTCVTDIFDMRYLCEIHTSHDPFFGIGT